MRYEIKIRNSVVPNEVKILKGFNKFGEKDEFFYKDLSSTTGYTIAVLKIKNIFNAYWCNCKMLSTKIFDSPKGIEEKSWNYKFNSLEEAINGGTLYALKRAGILFSVERKE